MTSPEATARSQDAAVRAVEAALTAALLTPLAVAIAAALAPLAAALAAGGDAARAALTVSLTLRRIKPRLGEGIRRALPKAVAAGAGRRITAPVDDDPLIQQAIDDADRAVRAKLAEAADRLLFAGFDPGEVGARADVALSEARGAVAQAVNRAAALGAEAAAQADGVTEMTWWAERDACLHCLAYSGRTRPIDGTYPGGLTFADKPLPWTVGGVGHPPLHRWCRCREVAHSEGLARALRREAARSVARGFSHFASRPARLRAVDRLLRGKRPPLPRSVRRRARRDLAAGAFSSRHNRRVPSVAAGTKPFAPGEFEQLLRRHKIGGQKTRGGSRDGTA